MHLILIIFSIWRQEKKRMTRRIGCCPFGCVLAPCNNITILTLTVLSSVSHDKNKKTWPSIFR